MINTGIRQVMQFYRKSQTGSSEVLGRLMCLHVMVEMRLQLFFRKHLLNRTPTHHLPLRGGGNLDTAFAQEPSTPLDLGIQLLNEGKLDEALKAFENALTLDPGNPLPHYYAGVAYHRKRQPVPAMSSLNRALSLRPGMPEVILEIGSIMEGLGLFDKAREAYRSVAGGKENAELAGEAGERLRRLALMEH